MDKPVSARSATSNWPPSQDVITFCVNNGRAGATFLAAQIKTPIKSAAEGGKKGKIIEAALCPSFRLFALSSCISKSGSMETHLALSGVLAEGIFKQPNSRAF